MVRSEALEQLCRFAREAALSNSDLYELFALVDLIAPGTGFSQSKRLQKSLLMKSLREVLGTYRQTRGLQAHLPLLISRWGSISALSSEIEPEEDEHSIVKDAAHIDVLSLSEFYTRQCSAAAERIDRKPSPVKASPKPLL